MLGVSRGLICFLIHGLKQHVRPDDDVLPFRVLLFGVAHAVDAGNEDHTRRTDIVEVVGVVSSAADHLHGGSIYRLCGLGYRLDTVFIERVGVDVHDLLTRSLEALTVGCPLDLVSNLCHCPVDDLVIIGAQIDCESDCFRDNIDRVRRDID